MSARPADKVVRRARTAVLCAALSLGGAPPDLTAQIAPDGSWSTVDTERFRITYPAGLDSLAARAGGIAERAWAELSEYFGPADIERVELLLTDDTDASNGMAGVAPYPRAIVYLRPPIDGFALSNFDDWLDLVITHELVHVLHLDRAGWPGRTLRQLFGRVPSSWPLFPEFAAPGWVIEGMATWLESRITGRGRVAGSDFEMAVRTAALAGQLEAIDAASGDSPQWPAGLRRYIYGALFLDWMAERHGDEALIDFVDEVADAWIPWRLNAAARSAFGESFSEAWELWRVEVGEEAGRVAADALPVEVLPETRGRRYAVHPVRRGEWTAWTEIAAGADPAVRIRDAAGRESTVRVNGLAHFDLLPDGTLLVAQREYDGPWRDRTDLWRIDPWTGASERLTRDARLDQPSVSPDGRWAVAVRYLPGGTELVRVDLETGAWRTLVPATGSQVGFPAVSPDGARIAGSVWRTGVEIVVWDARTGEEIGRPAADGALNLAPAWDGPDRLVWGSDRSGVSQIVRARIDASGRAVDPIETLTRVATGARFPAAVGGGAVIFSHYHADGWELARVDGAPLPAAAEDPVVQEPERAPLPDAVGDPEPYRAWPTLRPRYWEPVFSEARTAGGAKVVGEALGGRTRMQDLLGRWVVDAQASVATGGEVSAGLNVSWRELGNPVLGLQLDRRWNAQGPFTVERESGARDRLVIRERESRAAGLVTFYRNRWRSAAALTLDLGVLRERRELLDLALRPETEFGLRRPTATLADVGATVAWSTVRSAPVSISAEEGVGVTLSARHRADVTVADSLQGVRGEDRSRDEYVATLRGYRSFDGPGFADHVIALRVRGALTRGSGSTDFDWAVGGTPGSPEPFTGLDLFGQAARFGVRGYPLGARSGYRVWSASAEYRFPLALVDGGVGLIPIHLDRLHAALFLDAGGAERRDGEAGATLVSTGLEVRSEWLALFQTRFSLRLGVAVPGDGATDPSLYLRFGSVF